MMDYRFPGFLHKPNYFSNYYDSNFYFQCEANRIENTLSYIKDIDTDGNDEIFSLESIHASSSATYFIIYKYVNQEWKEVLYSAFFGWEEFRSDENYTKEEWYTPKPFPYDFVEYKGKVGLRIISYDRPKDWPTHYHAQFWAYDEETQKYEMLEEIWEAEEDTPPGGLIFTRAKEGLNCTALFQMCNLNLSVFLQRQNYRANGCTAVFRSSGIALDAPTSLVICS